MGPPGRVSQIELGELATIEAVARYVEALGGQATSSPASVFTPSPSLPPKRHALIHVPRGTGVLL